MSNSEQRKTIIDKIKSNKKIQTIIIAVLSVVLVIIFISSFKKTETASVEESQISDYVLRLENRLESALTKVEGAGNVSVVITIESGMETVLATEKTVKQIGSTVETTESPVIINGKPIVLKEMYPKIIGVMIVAEGANNISVLSRIQQATVSLLDININQIEILTMK